MIHAGIGPTHVNAFLSAVNVPPIATGTFYSHQNEIGITIEKVAKQSCSEVAKEERIMAAAEQDINEDQLQDIAYLDVAVSYDMMWLKRGRAHNSLTGFGAVMGTHMKKVLDYDVVKKKCRQCDVSQRLGIHKEHDCRKNYFGSSKGMEAHSATKLFKRSNDVGLKYTRLIGDDDASTIARLHREVDDSIVKSSDPTHSKRTLAGKLKPLHA